MICKPILYFGKNVILVCDAQCNKAWGNNNRPFVRLSQRQDDIEWLSDEELSEAPANPGTYEGDEAKPTYSEERLNKWCARECERSRIVDPCEDFKLHDWTKRVQNIQKENKQ